MLDEEKYLLLLLALCCCKTLILSSFPTKQKRKRRIWVKEWLKKRETLGAYNTIIAELQLQDRYSYIRYLRMNCETFGVSSYLITEINKTVTLKKHIFPEYLIKCLLRNEKILLNMLSETSYSFFNLEKKIILNI